MSNHNSLALSLITFLAVCLLICEPGGTVSSCRRLWADCPGIVNDYEICNSASGLKQEIRGDTRYFSYYNCGAGKRTPTLTISASCSVGFRD